MTGDRNGYVSKASGDASWNPWSGYDSSSDGSFDAGPGYGPRTSSGSVADRPIAMDDLDAQANQDPYEQERTIFPEIGESDRAALRSLDGESAESSSDKNVVLLAGGRSPSAFLPGMGETAVTLLAAYPALLIEVPSTQDGLILLPERFALSDVADTRGQPWLRVTGPLSGRLSPSVEMLQSVCSVLRCETIGEFMGSRPDPGSEAPPGIDIADPARD